MSANTYAKVRCFSELTKESAEKLIINVDFWLLNVDF